MESSTIFLRDVFMRKAMDRIERDMEIDYLIQQILDTESLIMHDKLFNSILDVWMCCINDVDYKFTYKEERYPDIPQWFEECDWGCTNEQHIWHNVTTDKYHFSDETSNFDAKGYDTIEEAQAALQRYCDCYL